MALSWLPAASSLSGSSCVTSELTVGGNVETKEEEEKEKKNRWLDKDQRVVTGRAASHRTSCSLSSPSPSQQLVSLLAPSAWIRGDGWTDWPVGEDHSQKNSANLPPAASTTLTQASSSFLPPSPLENVLRRGEGPGRTSEISDGCQYSLSNLISRIWA